jgi:hypothetical protein
MQFLLYLVDINKFDLIHNFYKPNKIPKIYIYFDLNWTDQLHTPTHNQWSTVYGGGSRGEFIVRGFLGINLILTR